MISHCKFRAVIESVFGYLQKKGGTGFTSGPVTSASNPGPMRQPRVLLRRLVQNHNLTDRIRPRRFQMIIRSAVTQSGAPFDQYLVNVVTVSHPTRTTRRIPPYTRVADLLPWLNDERNLDHQCFQRPQTRRGCSSVEVLMAPELLNEAPRPQGDAGRVQYRCNSVC
jgi:hypothetical protein